jgi:glycosyltransferase involved in cell wall biosynthesis
MNDNKKLTVLQLLPALESGGVERGTLEVARALVKDGHRALVMSAGGRQVAPLAESGAEHFAWAIGKKSLGTLLLIRKLRRFLLEQKVDIIHARSRVPAWVAYLAWRGMNPATRPRWVTTVHGTYSVSAYSAVMLRGERVIAISRSIVNYIERNYPDTSRDKIRLIYRGVDPGDFPYGYQSSTEWFAQWQREHSELAGKKILLLPARLSRRKGQTDFIEMLAQVVKQRSDVHGLIVGETHPRKRAFKDELVALAARYDVSQHLGFISHRSDLRELMATSSIVYSLSLEPEAFGRVSLEALALGKPLIAYDHGGVSEQLSALLPAGAIAVGDIAAAAQRTLDWLAAPPCVPAENPFTLERMLTATLGVYTELAALPRRQDLPLNAPGR